MATKLDQKWAFEILLGIPAEQLSNVRALILEIQRLEAEVEQLQQKQYETVAVSVRNHAADF